MNSEHQSIFNPYIIETFIINENNVPYPVGTHFPKRIVRFYELELITGGSGTIITNGEVTTASKGDVFLRVPGTVVEGYSGYYFIVVAFDAVYDNTRKKLYSTFTPYWVPNEKEMLSDTGVLKNVPYRIKTFNFELEALFYKVLNEFTKYNQSCQLILKSYLMNIFSLLIFTPEITDKNVNTRSFENNYELIKSSKDYIDHNLHKDFTLSGLAEMCHMSKNFYCKIFKSIFGVSPFDYIAQSRINKAKKLLITTNIKISDISIMCGISDITYFYKIFKKYVNMTPANYRKRYSIVKPC
jgi:AraC-like DNA-binding protein